MLNTYITDTQDLLNDPNGNFFKIPRLISYINKSRRRIAAASGCLRLIPPGVLTVPMQEVYPVSAWNALIQDAMPGTQSILFVNTISIGIGGKWQNGEIVGGSWKPTWRRIPFIDFEGRFRVYGRTFYGTISDPGWWAQLGVASLAKIYLAPIPAAYMPMEVDVTLVPADLQNDGDPEPIPYPWTDAVSYWTAVLCLMQQQRREDATAMAQLFSSDLPFCAKVVCPYMIQSVYGATLRAA